MAFPLTLPPAPSLLGPLRPATTQSASAPAGSPREQYAGTAEAAPPEATLRARAQDQVRRGSLAASLLDSAGPGAPSAAEKAALVSSLSKVDPAVLELANNNNIRFGVVHKGDDMLHMGTLKPRSFDEYQQRLPEMRAAGDRAAAVETKYDAKIQLALRNQPKPAAAPGFGNLNQSAEAQQKILLLDQEKRAAVDEALVGGKHGIGPFTLPRSGDEPTDMMGLPIQPYTGPMPTAMMASLAGASKPEQVKEYETLLGGINGKRLTEARAESLQMMEKNIATLPAGKQAEARAGLAKLKENPGQIPIDHEKHHIYAPDLYYVKDAQGQSARLNMHDASSVKSWAGPDGKSRGRWNEKSNPQGSLTDGEFFRDTNKVLIQSDALKSGAATGTGHGDTPIHELGHGLENIVRNKDPKFHDAWAKKLEAAQRSAAETAFTSPAEASVSISRYALTNPREYLAEGVSHYYDDPKLLKTKDPTLYGLTQEFLEHAKTLK